MVFYLSQKKYKKRLNGSKYIAIWEIEQSDWSRDFKTKSREQESTKVQKAHSCPFLDTFSLFGRKWEFCWKMASGSVYTL